MAAIFTPPRVGILLSAVRGTAGLVAVSDYYANDLGCSGTDHVSLQGAAPICYVLYCDDDARFKRLPRNALACKLVKALYRKGHKLVNRAHLSSTEMFGDVLLVRDSKGNGSEDFVNMDMTLDLWDSLRVLVRSRLHQSDAEAAAIEAANEDADDSD